MKQCFAVLILVLGAPTGWAAAQLRSEITLPPNGNNQRAEVAQWIGLVKVSIAYHSPRVHLRGTVDRTGHVWGEVIKFGFFDDGFGPSKATPWRAGANETTTITVSHDVRVEGKDLKAGSYGLFLDVEPSGPWNWIFSRDSAGWGSFQYDPAHDALRIPVTPQDAPFTEFLTYGFDNRVRDGATAYLQWENKRVPFRIDVPNVNELYIAQIRNDLQSWPGFNYQNWQLAAQFAATNRVDLEEALVWANKAIYEPFRNAAQGQADYSTLQTKATVLEALGRQTDADTTMLRAIRSSGATAPGVHQYGMALLQSGRTEKALEIFKLNRQQHPEEPFWTYFGLARGFTASGDRKNAIANWEIALKNVPPSLAGRVPSFEQALRTLKEGR